MHRNAFSTDIAHQAKSAKQAERAWHDAFYAAHGSSDYPETLAEFQERFRRVELTPFCEGGWNWWADPRREALATLGEVRGLSVLDYGCGAGGYGDDPVALRRDLRVFRGKVKKVIGLDVDPSAHRTCPTNMAQIRH